MNMTQASDPDITVRFVATDPASLSEIQKRDARRLASRMKVPWSGVKKFDSVMESEAGSGILVLVGDDWQDMTKRWAKQHPEPGPEVSPIWMGTAAIDDMVDYFELTECEDLDKRLKFLYDRKKIACVFGYCQSRPLRELMSRHKPFADDYYIIKMPFVQDVNQKIRADGFDETLLKKLDVLVTMNVSRENKYSEKVSTEYMTSKLAKKCRVVKIPNCYFTAYFPQAYSRNIRETQPFLKTTVNDRLTERDCYAEESLQTGCELSHPTAQEINSNLERTVTELIERERLCDVRMSDYILENYKKRRLFYSRSHPSNEVLEEHAKRILTYMGYPCKDIDSKGVYRIDYRKEFIYPETYDVLGLEFRDDSYINRHVSPETFDEELYISMLRFFKQPDYWQRSIRWITEPMKRSIDFSANVDSTELVKIISHTLSVTDSAAHLSLDMIVNEDIKQRKTVANIPNCMTPSNPYFTMGRCMSGNIVKVRINPDGKIEFTTPIEKDEEVLVDTTWLL